MPSSLYSFNSIYANCYKHQGYTIVCSWICLCLVILLIIFTSKRKHLLAYLPLLNHLPIFLWGFYATLHLMDFMDWMLNNQNPPFFGAFSLWAVYQYIPLIQVMVFSGISSLITDKSEKYKTLKLSNSFLASITPTIIIGTVSCNWLFIWYFSDAWYHSVAKLY